MSGPGVISMTSLGAVTTPTSQIALSVGASASTSLLEQARTYGALDALYLPSIRAVMFVNGIGLNYHALEGTTATTVLSYPTGILGAALAITAAPTSVRATATMTFTAATRPNDGDKFDIQIYGTSTTFRITWKDTLSTSGDAFDVKRGADLATCISNLASLINATGTDGTNFYFHSTSFGGPYTYTYFRDTAKVEVSATTATVVTFRIMAYGTNGNYSTLTEITDGGGTWAVVSFAGGAAGTGTAPDAGTYGFRDSRIRTTDSAISYASPVVTVTQSTNCNINLTSFVASPARDQYDFHRWYRTTNGGSVYYRGADVAAGTGEPYVDSYTDATIQGAFAVKYDDRLYRPYTSGYPVKCAWSCIYKGRVFMGGARRAAVKFAGTASVPATASASYSVTMTLAAHPTVDWIGRTFQVSGDAQTYIIVNVTESTRVLTLNLPFNGTGAYNAGAANATASYTVTDDRNPFTVYFSEPNLPNNWPTTNSLDGRISSSDTSGISGMKSAWGSVVVWTQTGVHRLDGDTGSGFRMEPVGEGLGTFNGRCVVDVNGTLYWLGANGISRWGGSGVPDSLSKPTGTGTPQGINRTLNRLNLSQRDMFHGNFNPTENVIRWWVALDGETNNRYAIVYDLQTDSFATDTAEEFTASVTVPDQNGQLRTLVGDAYGNIFQLDISASDGVYANERITTVSSYDAGTNKITVPATLTASALIGAPIWHYPIAGTSQPQRQKCIANTTSVITLAGPLTTAPVSTDYLVAGGIFFDVMTGQWDQAEAYKKRGLPAVSATVVPALGQLWCAVGKDGDEPTVYAPGTVRGFTASDSMLTGAVSTPDGFKVFWHRKGLCRRLCVRFFGWCFAADFGVVGWMPTVATRDEVGG